MRAADAPKNTPSKAALPGKAAPAKDAPPSSGAPPNKDAPPSPDAANKAEAARRFDRGLQLFNESDNAGALAEFKQTYAIMPNPIVLYNIGLVYAAMGRPVDAVDALSAVVGSAALSPEQHEHAQSTLTDQQARIGRVSVTTVPEGARIDVDGVEIATTPLSAPLRVAEGSHVIGAVAEGYAHAHKEIVVAGNADASVSFELVLGQNKVPANLTVHSRTLGAEVKVDDKAAGTTPLATSLSIPSGHHLVELSRPGYQTLKQEIDLGEGATGDVTLDLAVDPGSLATNGADLVIDSREPNLEVTLDDERLGLYSAPLRLPKGAHHLRLRVAGYLPYETDLNLEAGKPFVLSPYLMPTPETRQAHDSNVRLHRVLGWGGIGLGTVMTGASVALVVAGGASKSSAQKDFAAAEFDVTNNVGDCNGAAAGAIDACNARVDDAQSRVNSAKTEQLVGFVGIGVGVAVVATGIVFLVTGEDPHRFDAPKKSQTDGPRWALLPGPGQFGMALGASF
ncbi:MAG TPA: PEGA domain-containing protein [Polyangiaceae bacterium]